MLKLVMWNCLIKIMGLLKREKLVIKLSLVILILGSVIKGKRF